MELQVAHTTSPVWSAAQGMPIPGRLRINCDAGAGPGLRVRGPDTPLPATQQQVLEDVSEDIDLEEMQPTPSERGEADDLLRQDSGEIPCQGSLSKIPQAPNPFYVMIMVVGHAISTSGLLVVNKWALQRFPYVWLLTTLQFLPAAMVVGSLGALGVLDVDPLEFRKVVAFLPAAGMFFITMTAGNAVVKITNVDTFIVLRALVPLPCALLETFALGEPFPSPQSWLGLLTLVAGALIYANANKGLATESYEWMILFLVMMPIDGVLIKHLINTIGLNGWGLVLYQNLIAGCMGLWLTSMVELQSVDAAVQAFSVLVDPEISAWKPVFLTTCLGILLSFFQMTVRRLISSTAFMVLGVANKLLALLLNQISLQANRDFMSVSGVVISIGGAVAFQRTVQGQGISQANPQKTGARQGLRQSYIAMLLGMLWSVALMHRSTLSSPIVGHS